MSDEWNGDERRHDHDLLTKTYTLLETHVNNFEKHTAEDKEHFQRLYTSTGELKRFVYIATGVIAAVEFGLKYLHK